MAFSVREHLGYSIVEMSGDIDLSCSPEARKIILECLAQRHDVLVDLSGVTYIDSSGVASLVEGFQTAKKGNLRFGLVGPSEPALNVLTLARLDKVFEIHPTIEERVAEDG